MTAFEVGLFAGCIFGAIVTPWWIMVEEEKLSTDKGKSAIYLIPDFGHGIYGLFQYLFPKSGFRLCLLFLKLKLLIEKSLLMFGFYFGFLFMKVKLVRLEALLKAVREATRHQSANESSEDNALDVLKQQFVCHVPVSFLPNASALPRDERTQPIQPTTPTPGSSAAAPGSELDHKE